MVLESDGGGIPTIQRKGEVDLTGEVDGAGWSGSANGGWLTRGDTGTADLSSAGTSGKTPNTRLKIVSTALMMVAQMPGMRPTMLKIVIVEASSARMIILTMMRRLFRRFLLLLIEAGCCICCSAFMRYCLTKPLSIVFC